MTLFLHTGAVGLKARAFITSVVAAVIVMSATCPAWSASPADLAGPLRDLVALDTANQLTPANPLARMVHVQGGKVLVEVLCNGSASAHVATLQQLGATVDKCRDRRAQIVVPVSRLMDIALLPNVAQVRVPPYGMPEQIGPTVSEGVQLTNALSLQMAGITGLGASVAIIDAGFLGYTGAELPASVTARSFRADGIIDGITDHGTAVAEIVADMAPNATMYLLAVATTMDAESAFEWCLQNDIDIVTLSLGWVEGPFDGTHSLDRVVDRVRAGGVLPVKSSGNRAQQHWMGEWLDSDGDRLLEFAKSDEGIGIVTTTANEPIVVNLSWYETAGPTGAKAEVTDRDYDLELVDGTGQVIARSAVTQNGDDPPSETLYAYAPTPGQYDIRVRAVSSNIATGPTEAFQLFSSHDVDTALQVPETSLTIPGAASGIVTVGATRAVADLPDPIIDYPVDTLEPFSSQGPTVDGRQKPELSAPDGVQTSTSQNPFLGTSAAAPHVAGAAALLKSEDGTRTADELATVLVRLATEQNLIAPIKLPSGTNAQPPQCGAGRVSLRSGLDTKPPTISITFPVNGSTITTATPTIVGVVKDSETGVDAGTIVMTVDGTEVQWDSFTPGSGVVTYTPPAPLSRSSHTVTLVASDMVGNEGEAAVSNFRVGLPTLSAGLHMISLPFCNLTITNPAIIFGVNLDEFAQVRWVATDAAFNKYRIYPDPLASFVPPDALGANPTVASPPAGLGYFVNLPHNVVLNVAGEALTDVTDYTIQLPLGTSEPRGWHMIGNPFQDKIDWSTVQFVTNGRRQDLDDAIAAEVTEGIIFEYVPAAGAQPGHYAFVEARSAVLEPLKGYWLHVNVSTAVVIYPATVAGGEVSKKPSASAAQPTLDNWKLQLIASAPGMLDTCNYLGVSPQASSARDVGADVPEPPALGKMLRAYFPHRNWGNASGDYTQDLRARAAAKQTWAFEVDCPTANVPVTLSWPDLNAVVPRELSVRLEDLDSGQAVSMRGSTSYTFRTIEPGVRHFEITVGPTVTASLQITTLTASMARDGSVIVTYALSAPASVSASIRNITGRPVRTLMSSREVAEGTQTLVWDARADSGVKVPLGTYLLQLSARSSEGETVQRILPIRAAR